MDDKRKNIHISGLYTICGAIIGAILTTGLGYLFKYRENNKAVENLLNNQYLKSIVNIDMSYNDAIIAILDSYSKIIIDNEELKQENEKLKNENISLIETTSKSNNNISQNENNSQKGFIRSSVRLAIGESEKLRVPFLGGVKWESRNTKIATVTQSGKVEARSVGTTTITAKVNNRTYKTTITVDNPRFDKSELTLIVGDTYDLKLTGTERRFKFESTDPDIVEVNDTEIKAVNLGDCVIYAYSGRTEIICTVHVVDEEEL